MSLPCFINQQLTAGFATRGGRREIDADSVQNFDGVIPAHNVNKVIAGFNFHYDLVLFIYMLSDEDITIYWNGHASPHPSSFTLHAGIPYIWTYDSHLPNPFASVDVTTLEVTSGASDTSLSVSVGLDIATSEFSTS